MATPTQGSRILIGAVLTVLIAGMTAASSGSCAPPTPAQIEKAESDLCRARAAEKLVFASAGGKLDPVPGSTRAKIEQAEDELCAARADASAPAASAR